MPHILCGVCKDIAWNIPNIKNWFSRLIDCVFVIYEDSSSDNTSVLLSEWSNENANIIVKSEQLSNEYKLQISQAHTWDNKPCRMEMIALARNKMMDMVKEVKSKSDKKFDSVVMLDLDNKVPFPVHTFLRIIQKYKGQYDTLICNGVEFGTNVMYDAYAFRSEQRPYGPEIIGDSFWQNYSLEGLITSDNLMPVLSGFNGCCIFSPNIIDEIEYSAFVTREMNEYYKNHKSRITQIQGQVQTHYKGVLLGEYLFGTDSIFYHNNSGYSKPVVCEHVSMFFGLIYKGHSRIFVCPEFRWDWTR